MTEYGILCQIQPYCYEAIKQPLYLHGVEVSLQQWVLLLIQHAIISGHTTNTATEVCYDNVRSKP